MGILILISLLLLLTYLLNRFVVLHELSKKDVLIGWFIKIGFGLAYLCIFIIYYGHGSLYGDSSCFFSDSKILAEIAINEPWEYIKLLFGLADENSPALWPYIERTNIWMYGDNGDFINDNRLILRLNSIIHLFSFGNIYVHSLIHVFISFIGIKLIYQVFSNYVKQKKWFWYALVIAPSVSFWSDSILKESLLIFGIGILFYAIHKLIHAFSVKSLVILLLGGGILLFNKPYAGLIILAISSLLSVGYYLQWKTKWIYMSVILIVFVFIGLMFAPSKINLTEKVSYKQKDLMNMGRGGVFFINDSSFCAFDYDYLDNFEMVNDSLIKVVKSTRGEYKLFGEYEFHSFEIKESKELYPHYLTQIPSTSYYETVPIQNSNSQLIKNIPSVLVNVLLRPFPWDNGNKLKILAFLHNMGLIFLVVSSILKRRKLKDNEKWIVFVLVMSSFFITLLIGWTTPIFGASVRYKIPVDLFIIIISFILLKSNKHEKV